MSNTYTEYQVDVVSELTEMRRLMMISKKIMEKARLIVWDNVDDTFSESSGIKTSEAADLAVELARVTK